MAIIALAVMAADAYPADPKTRVACLGDSITEGTYNNVYPTLLGELLGEKYEVKNFGVGSATLLTKGTKPYVREPAYAKALEYKPAIVIVLLGTNDSKAGDWERAGGFVNDYAELLAPFQRLDPKPRIFVCTPPPVKNDLWGLQGKVVAEEVCAKVMEAAKDHTLIDVHAAFKKRKDKLYADGVHPNAAGTKLLADAVLKAVAPELVLRGAEGKAIEDCITMIRACQLPDGAFAQVNHGTSKSAPVWIAPYFAHHGALALLAAHDRRPAPADLAAVGRWLEWCAKNQAPEGYWNDFEGTFGGYRNNGTVDAWDSSAAMFLIVVDRYRQVGGKPSEAVLAAVKKAVACLVSVTDTDGLTWAKPSYKVKFLMDNIETYAGYTAAAELFAAMGDEIEAAKARASAAAIGKALPDFWLRQERLFSFAIHENGRYEGGLGRPYPHGLAQLYGVAFVSPMRTDAWSLTCEVFAPDGGPAAEMPSERWLLAAARLERKDLADWKAKVVKDVSGFKPDQIYINRPAIAALGLLEGADWIPSVAADK